MADDKIAKNGVYLDTRTGKVVRSQPEEGVQLVPPGGEITRERQAAIDRAESEAQPVETATTKTAEKRTTSKKS